MAPTIRVAVYGAGPRTVPTVRSPALPSHSAGRTEGATQLRAPTAAWSSTRPMNAHSSHSSSRSRGSMTRISQYSAMGMKSLS